MAITYIRRFRMEVDFQKISLPAACLPAGYHWGPWNSSSMTRHADVKFGCFHSELDSDIFPCLGSVAGCHRLMQEIARHESFLPDATWLIVHRPDESESFSDLNFEDFDCAAIQGLASSRSTGSIQNVGVLPDHRGMGLGRALVLKCLHGFRKKHIRRVSLEVTADNKPAVDLYKSIGFRVVRTMYKALDLEPVEAC